MLVSQLVLLAGLAYTGCGLRFEARGVLKETFPHINSDSNDDREGSLPAGNHRSGTSEEQSSLPHRPTGRTLNDYDKYVTGESVFINRLDKFRSALYADGQDLHQQLLSAVNGGAALSSSELAVRSFSDQRTITWFPVQCKSLGIRRLRREAKLKDSGHLKNSVYRMIDVDSGKQYAYKLFGKPDDYTSEVTFFMVAAGHPNIVKPVCIQREQSSHSSRAGLLLEYVEGESSLDVAKRSSTTTDDLQLWSAKLLNVLTFIHRKGLIHADLKPENILIDAQSGELIVIDFGFAVPLPHEHPGRGNFAIKAPEVADLINGRLHEGLDMWAYGSTLATWYGFKHLPDKKQLKKKPYVMVTIGRNKKYAFGSVPEAFPPPLRAVLYLMTVPNPNLRTFNTETTRLFLRGLKFFSGIDWNSLDQQQLMSQVIIK